MRTCALLTQTVSVSSRMPGAEVEGESKYKTVSHTRPSRLPSGTGQRSWRVHRPLVHDRKATRCRVMYPASSLTHETEGLQDREALQATGIRGRKAPARHVETG